MKPIRIANYFHIAIQERGHGLVLEGNGDTFDRLSPGDWVEAQGRISKRAGLPVVVVSRITTGLYAGRWLSELNGTEEHCARQEQIRIFFATGVSIRLAVVRPMYGREILRCDS